MISFDLVEQHDSPCPAEQILVKLACVRKVPFGAGRAAALHIPRRLFVLGQASQQLLTGESHVSFRAVGHLVYLLIWDTAILL